MQFSSPSFIAANVAAGCLIVLLVYIGWRTWLSFDRTRRANRQRELALIHADEQTMERIIRAWVRVELLPRALAAQCDVILRTQFEDDNYSRKVPELTALTADDFALLAGDVR